MKSNKIILTICGILVPTVLLADVWDNPLSLFYLMAYVYVILPVILWITNIVYTIQSLRGIRYGKWVRYWVHYPSIVLGIISLIPVITDINTDKDDFEDYWFVLIPLVVVPITAAIASIRIQKQLVLEAPLNN